MGCALLVDEPEEAAASPKPGTPLVCIATAVGSHWCLVSKSPRLTLSRKSDLADGLVSLSSTQPDPLSEDVAEQGLCRRT